MIERSGGPRTGHGTARVFAAVISITTALVAAAGTAAQTSPAGEDVEVRGRLLNGGSPLAGAAIFLVPVYGPTPSEGPDTVTIDQEHLTFVPGSVVVTPESTVRFRNSDPLMHNIFSPGSNGFDLGTHARDEVVERRFTEVGVHVMLCNIHPEMVAYVNVVASPLNAVVRTDGTFLLGDVPEGDYLLRVWVPMRPEPEPLTISVGPRGMAELDLVLSRNRLTLR